MLFESREVTFKSGLSSTNNTIHLPPTEETEQNSAKSTLNAGRAAFSLICQRAFCGTNERRGTAATSQVITGCRPGGSRPTCLYLCTSGQREYRLTCVGERSSGESAAD